MRTTSLRLTLAAGALALAACSEPTAPAVSPDASLSRGAAAAAKPGTATIVELDERARAQELPHAVG